MQVLSRFAGSKWREHLITLGVITIAWYLLVSPYLHLQYLSTDVGSYVSHIPIGLEFTRSIAQFYVWERVWECGTCALWSPNMGGFPVLNDYFSSFMHPFSAVFSSLFGGTRGAIYTLAFSFLLIGIATWWLLVSLEQSPLVQIWASVVAMYGGHMTGRLETGTIGLPLSLASVMLVFAATVAFVGFPSVRRAVMLGVSGGALLLAGQLYMQLGTVIALPILVALIHTDVSFKTFLYKNIKFLGLAVVIALCLIAPFALTFLFEYGSTYKRNYDLELLASQPIGFLILNMVIDQTDFYRVDILQKLPYTYAYATFVGYPVIIFAILGIMLERDDARRQKMLAFAILAAINFVLAAAIPQKLIMRMIPEEWAILFASMRFIVLLNGIAVICVIIVASYGLQAVHPIVKQIKYNLFVFNPAIVPFLWQGMLLLVLIWHIGTLQSFARNWVHMMDVNKDVYELSEDVAVLPHGYVNITNGIYEMPLMEKQTKIFDLNPGWYWVGTSIQPNPAPPPARYFVINNSEMPDPENTSLISDYNGWRLVMSNDPQTEYASVVHNDGTVTPCQANAQAGFVSISCDAQQNGVLRVYEFNRGHWIATVDGSRSPVLSNEWLGIKLSAGKHSVTLQYMPWYTSLSIILLMLGIILSTVLLVRPQLAQQVLHVSAVRD
ncbi:MAG: hypothetical protein ACK5GU_00735 [Chloroflexota bacterium]|jgi:hypothetical protein